MTGKRAAAMGKSKFPLVMKTLAAITSALTVVFTILYHHTENSGCFAAAITFGTTAYHFVMRLMVGAIVPKATNYDFDYHSRWFQPRIWEPELYRKLRVKQWKGKLPTYAPHQFSLQVNTLHRIIQNMCGAEIVHEIIMVLSFLPLALIPRFGEPWVFTVTSLLSALFDSLFVIAQRFNRPRLVRLREKQQGNSR